MFLLLLLISTFIPIDCVFHIKPDYLNQCSVNEVPFPDSKCEPFDEVFQQAYDYLENNLPSWDLINKETLGFHTTDGANVDGLENGIATLGINISLEAKQKYFWAGNVDKETYFEFVIPYAHVNEARNNWRPYLTNVTERILNDYLDITDSDITVEEVVTVINENLWSRHYLGSDVVFKSSQTPLIYDPMSTIVFGFASCTGVSILLADALRCVGIPARVSGTPAWNGEMTNGNHNWVEVFDYKSQQWNFIEATPAGADETLSNPCDKWFCTSDKMKGGTQVYSTRWTQSESIRYPMAWDVTNVGVPGVNRTDYYQSVCNKC